MNKGHVKSSEIINLESLKDDMEVDSSYALVKTNDMEVIRMALPKGKHIEKHQVDGEASIQCLKGNIHFKIDNNERKMAADDWMYLEKSQPFSYEVKSDTILLVTILFVNSSQSS